MSRLETDRAAALAASIESQARAKRESEKHTCDGNIFSGYRSYRCGVGAKHEHEGRWYCKTHHPPTVEAKYAVKRAARSAEYAARTEQIRANQLAADEQKRRADCYDDLLEALIRLLDADRDQYLTVQGVRNLASAVIRKATGDTK